MGLISYISSAFTVDGTSNGIITIASTANYRKAAIVYLSSDTVSSVELVIDEILSSTTLAVKVKNGFNYVRYDASALTVADNALIVQPEQYDFFTQDDTSVPGSIGLFDEGVVQTPAGTSLNFIGPNVSVDPSGNVTIDSLYEPVTLSQVLTANAGATFGEINVYEGATGITAFATGGQASATQLAAEVNFVTTVATIGDSVKLPIAALGKRIVVFNLGANDLDIFPLSGVQIDALGVDAAISLAAGSSIEFWGQSATQWYSV